ncbi:aspartyl-phosphate phosphatase Spo0E family protein [Paenibacillus sp. 23TSA30-6]|uniref:aspartyl-phosphate phosphatase Spo0E family protein n=1 Tax=Paenibacillus sp. 23TSA30-6 TaxID=2546104 RepID=UPI001788564D|nr:aspartyl-phosphate phosphatase Spo0E family protein [Paenibacillus sp. 23TSA30-6]MBE0337756.1 aspartyl-phosphate phosphatase Spo0E family protein [Paenibacillus sp. 23TSA30-6]
MNIDETLTLNQQLENARQRLHDLYKQHGFGHACVLEQAMILDELINQYNRMYQTKKLHHHYVQSETSETTSFVCKNIPLPNPT